MAKLWGGRFQKTTDAFAEGFHSSISFDCRLYKQDILGSIAHARMLGEQAIIPKEDAQRIIAGLQDILTDIEAGRVEFNVQDEDIHMNVERLLIERIGDTGKRLHTGRSRNDQVALDIRMYMKDQIDEVMELLKLLCRAYVDIAEKNTDTVMCAYTHLQKAQPTTLAHYMMAYFEMFRRDISRFTDCKTRTDDMPLGSGALCATTYPLNREAVARELGFSHVTANSLDAVSDRDFLLEFLSCASVTMMHLSRACEEIILWSSNEFSTVVIDDAYSTGSSIMPQKKNPDMAELIRGKTGRVYGDLISLLTVLKGLPLAYNKDMQEDKECVFDAVDTLKGCLHVFTDMLKTLRFKKEKLRASAGLGFTNATDVADYLVKKGLPFRDAHAVVGHLVLYCEEQQIAINEIPLQVLIEYCPLFKKDIYSEISLEACVEKRIVKGGPAKSSVLNHIGEAKKFLSE